MADLLTVPFQLGESGYMAEMVLGVIIGNNYFLSICRSLPINVFNELRS